MGACGEQLWAVTLIVFKGVFSAGADCQRQAGCLSGAAQNVLLSVMTSATSASAIGDFFVWAGADLHFLFQCETAAVVFAVHCDWGVDYDRFCAADGQSDLLVCAGGDAWQQYCGQRDYICDLPRRYFSWRIAFSAL